MVMDREHVEFSEELARRLQLLQSALQAQAIEAALIVQKTDLFYFTGTAQQGWLWVPVSGKPLLLVFKDFQRALAETGVERVESLSSARKLPDALADYGYPVPGSLGLELDVLPAQHYLQYQKLFPGVELADISTVIREIRSVKSAYELSIVSEAAHRSDQVFARIGDFLQEGSTEVEAAGRIEGFARSLGHQGIVRMRMWGAELFYGHLMCGPSAAVPSYLASPTGGRGVSQPISQGAGFNRLSRDQPILVDYVFAYQGYIADHTRIFCRGTLPDELVAGHEAMRELQDEIAGLARPGVRCGDLYDRMIRWVSERGLEDGFMGAGERRIRFTGHGVGLELDEYPFIAAGQNMVLQENMTIALEPKLIMPGRGVVGIENTFVVRKNGLQKLTTSPEPIQYL